MYHPTLNLRAHKHVLKSPRLHSALPSSPMVAFRNPKTIRDKLVRSKLKLFIDKDAGTNTCGHSNCDICKILSHNGTHEDIKVQIIGHCDRKDQEAREDFRIFHLDTLDPNGLNQKCTLKY